MLRRSELTLSIEGGNASESMCHTKLVMSTPTISLCSRSYSIRCENSGLAMAPLYKEKLDQKKQSKNRNKPRLTWHLLQR